MNEDSNDDRPHELITRTFELCGHEFLSVFRSPLVRVTDEMYEPVAELLDRYKWDAVEHTEFDDPEWLLGSVIVDRYARELAPTTETVPAR
ncbi:MAG: hypothetical protein WA942_09190 [Mycolicibacter sinensis]